MILYDLIELHIEGPGQSTPIAVAKIPNGDPLPESKRNTFWIRTLVAKSEDELDQYMPQLMKRKC